jgi:succinate dehydrogenase / fumarate reductase membrane anchor subunit
MSMRTPLARVRGLGSAKSGTQAWWHERLSSLASLPLTIFVVIFIVAHLGATRAEMLASFGNPFIAILMGLAVISVLWHLRLGMQVIVEDYVHGHAAKFLCLILNNAYVVALGAMALYAIIRLNLGH